MLKKFHFLIKKKIGNIGNQIGKFCGKMAGKMAT
jgi:hypothetical protein